ncbi:Bromodomain-containing protein [Drosera capensis]
MKRKRGHKKTKSSKKPKAAAASPAVVDVEDGDDNSDSDDVEEVNVDESKQGPEAETRSTVEEVMEKETARVEKLGESSDVMREEKKREELGESSGGIERAVVDESLNWSQVRVIQKPVVVYGRVKLKLKNANKVAEESSRVVPLNDPTQSQTINRSSETVGVKKQTVVEKNEESGSELPEVEKAVASDSVVEDVPRKVGSIKIKSSKGVSSSDVGNNSKGVSSLDMGNNSKAVSVSDVGDSSKGVSSSDVGNNPKGVSSSDVGNNSKPVSSSDVEINVTTSGVLVDERSPLEPKVGRDVVVRYNKAELDASLEVIKKVMKMDAAEPFNAPVNPDEIPDYYDVIDIPMDFGTIQSNLESGSKYMNSEDVYRDVQYIWDNCCKYNNKGDYIVDLMRRLKKGFSKYWNAAGLYSETLHAEDGALSSHEKKPKKGKGFKQHKDGCMCAICIMRRRRQERVAREATEARGARGQDAHARSTTSTYLSGEFKQQESIHVESPLGGETSSYLETSPDINAEDIEDDKRLEETGTPQIDAAQKEVDVELHDEDDRSGDISEKSHHGSIAEDESNPTIESRLEGPSGCRTTTDAQKQLSLNQNLLYQQKKLELMELEKKRQKSKLFDKFRGLEYPMLLELSSTLFTSDTNSFWSGPHSLVHRQQKSSHDSGIHEAVASFMNSSSRMIMAKRT